MIVNDVGAILIIASSNLFVIGFYMGVRKKYWTPKKLRRLLLISLMPVVLGAAIIAVINTQGFMRIVAGLAVLLGTLGTVYTLSFLFTAIYCREPLRSYYHIHDDKENDNDRAVK